MYPQFDIMPFPAPTPRKANKSRQTTAVGGAATVVVGARRYALDMSLIDRAEARRKSAPAAMDSAGQAALGQYFTPVWCASAPTHMIHLNGDKFLGPHALEAS